MGRALSPVSAIKMLLSLARHLFNSACSCNLYTLAGDLFSLCNLSQCVASRSGATACDVQFSEASIGFTKFKPPRWAGKDRRLRTISPGWLWPVKGRKECLLHWRRNQGGWEGEGEGVGFSPPSSTSRGTLPPYFLLCLLHNEVSLSHNFVYFIYYNVFYWHI